MPAVAYWRPQWLHKPEPEPQPGPPALTEPGPKPGPEAVVARELASRGPLCRRRFTGLPIGHHPLGAPGSAAGGVARPGHDQRQLRVTPHPSAVVASAPSGGPRPRAEWQLAGALGVW
jgi:hypothetical protein